MPIATERRSVLGRAAQAAPAGNPHLIVAYISREPPPPIVYPPSSREVARRKAKAEAEARNAAAARQLQASVQRAYRPAPGEVFSVDIAGLLLLGPAGALGTSSKMAATLAPLAAGGRHPITVLMAAGGWADEQALREALAAIVPKLGALGLLINRRKAGLRMAKARP